MLQQFLRTLILLPKLTKWWLAGRPRAGREGRAAEETKEHCGVLILLPKLFTYHLQRDAKGEEGQTNHMACFPLLFTDIIYCNVPLKVEMRKKQMTSNWFRGGSINHKFPPRARLQSPPQSFRDCGWELAFFRMSPAASLKRCSASNIWKIILVTSWIANIE